MNAPPPPDRQDKPDQSPSTFPGGAQLHQVLVVLTEINEALAAASAEIADKRAAICRLARAADETVRELEAWLRVRNSGIARHAPGERGDYAR